ncbi:unnamed protein product [Rotaria sordida]|uniref:Uncharacterized protein n=1 Tax=Rotaria sordida TaxID=392033 RepID=A0A815LYH6_9BILA|nr:unnamed protein product [Rotaria sordida]CAF4000679.1 unnamed protein product [Rotaria sordida]
MTATQSSASLISVKQSNSPTLYSTTPMSTSHHLVIDQSLSAPLIHRKMNFYDDTNDSQQHHRLMLTTSQSKESPSRGISPRINRNKSPATNIYNPSSIEKL